MTTAVPDPVTLLERQNALAEFLQRGWPQLQIPGIPRVSAAAAVGNATQENACRSVTVGPKDHGSDGLFQWRLDRLTAMLSYCNRNFGTWQSIEAQAAFFVDECMSNYPNLWFDLTHGSKPLATLTANIMEFYERPAEGSEMLDNRIKYAREWLTTTPPVEDHSAAPSSTSVDASTPPKPKGTGMTPLEIELLIGLAQSLAPVVVKLLPSAVSPDAAPAIAAAGQLLSEIIGVLAKQMKPA